MASVDVARTKRLYKTSKASVCRVVGARSDSASAVFINNLLNVVLVIIPL